MLSISSERRGKLDVLSMRRRRCWHRTEAESAPGSEHRPWVSLIYTNTCNTLGEDGDGDDDDNDEYCSLTIGII